MKTIKENFECRSCGSQVQKIGNIYCDFCHKKETKIVQPNLCNEESINKTNAEHFLKEALDTIVKRGIDYDSPNGERSAFKTSLAFNAITGLELTESHVWLILSLLKKVRQYAGNKHYDSALDDISYSALFAESRMNENG